MKGKPLKIIIFFEHDNNKLTRGNSDLGIYLGKMMVSNVLTTKPGDQFDHFINRGIGYY